jgi:hypothetical protein
MNHQSGWMPFSRDFTPKELRVSVVTIPTEVPLLEEHPYSGLTTVIVVIVPLALFVNT